MSQLMYNNIKAGDGKPLTEEGVVDYVNEMLLHQVVNQTKVRIIDNKGSERTISLKPIKYITKVVVK